MSKVTTCLILAVCTLICASLPAHKEPECNPLPPEVLFQNSKKPEPLRLECDVQVVGSSVKYFWKKNGEPLPWTPTKENDGTLIIPQPSQDDEGKYQCFAETDVGISSSRMINVRYAFFETPKVIPKKLKPIEGRTFKLDCVIPNAYPKPDISWTFQPASSNEAKIVQDRRITQNSEGNLYFSNATKEDAGRYVCLAKTPLIDEPVPSAEYEIEGVEKDNSPKDNEVVKQYATSDTTVLLGTPTYYVYCIYGGNPLAHPDWFKDGKDTNRSPDDRVTRYNKSVGKRLLIKEVLLEDEGEYTCNVDNEVGKPQKHSFHLTVVSPPKVKNDAKEYVIKEGESVTLNCLTFGKPLPKMYWTFKTVPLINDTHRINAEENIRGNIIVRSLTIEKAEKSDAGYYGCQVENEYGEDYAETLLKVL